VIATTRILIVEDNDDLSFGLRRSLEAEGYEIDVAGDGPRGIAAARRVPPDLVILDLMLPGVDGFRVLETMRRDGLGMPVMILSAKGQETDKVHGLRVGADDYVTKPFGLSELLARVDALLRRGARADRVPEVVRFGDVEINMDARIVTKAGKAVALTPKEYELLIAFVRRPGAVLSRRELLRDVWGHSPDVYTRTVDIHVGEVRRKLETEGAPPRHFITVRKAGYRFDP
jgi:two-component system, OmpR family, alkaline phosphatase synthesis response regulator PhoP